MGLKLTAHLPNPHGTFLAYGFLLCSLTDVESRLREPKPKVLTNSFGLQTMLGVHKDRQVLQQVYHPLGSAAQWGPPVWCVDGDKVRQQGAWQHQPFPGWASGMASGEHGAGLWEVGESFHPS